MNREEKKEKERKRHRCGDKRAWMSERVQSESEPSTVGGQLVDCGLLLQERARAGRSFCRIYTHTRKIPNDNAPERSLLIVREKGVQNGSLTAEKSQIDPVDTDRQPTMIFEVPTKYFPPTTDAAKEVKKTSHVSSFEKFFRTEMTSMNKVLGGSYNETKSSFFDTTEPTISSSKVFNSSSGIGLTSAGINMIPDILSDLTACFKLIL
ncbi:hypothetical protein CRE_31220 [Caenorhabditis remanei]|uniref:Uncharacterized protein n=1 Tax=Caenorhabditis remanei TaxID=31234 RepID=E3MLN0_CAERE|nr:hypothetical protein CRE_31220 [Caenorhabditis remanei]